MEDYRNLVIEELADSEAALREQTTTLIEIIADIAFENFVLRRMFEQEFVERIQADGVLTRTRRTHRHRFGRTHKAAI